MTRLAHAAAVGLDAAVTLPPSSDEEQGALVRSCIAGDQKATQRLLRLAAPEVRRIVKGILGGAHPDFEDTIQESLLGFIKALPNFRFESNVLHYAVRIAFRAALATKRRSRTWRQRFWLGTAEDEADSAALSPSEGAISMQKRRALERALAKLPREQAEVVVLWIVFEYSISEIGQICEVSPNTVKGRLRLGRQALFLHLGREAALRHLKQEGA
jgi:RNA polymerase sigma-70 factor (ECF subfamily)